MSRLDEALRHLDAGEPAVLVDEDRADVCYLVVAEDAAGPGVLALVRREAASEPVLWLASDQPSSTSSVQAQVIGPGRGVAPYGVLEKAAGAEAAVDAVRLAGRRAAALLAPVLLPNGMLARDDAAMAFATSRGLPLLSIQDVIASRLSRESIIEAVAAAELPSLYADRPLEVRAFRSRIDASEHLALISAPLGREPMVRLHSECLTGDALGSLRCDCGDQLRTSLRMIAEHPEGGIVVYLRGQEGRGIGLANKIRAYALQDRGQDTVEANVALGFPADLRSYGVAVQILTNLGVSGVKLLSNNPDKQKSLERYGIRVVERLPLRIDANPHNAGYLETKRRKMGHDFEAPADQALALPV